jgi:UDP-glucuronate decarboxylase
MIIEECKEIIDSIDFKQLENKSVLVTGASGLVGLYIIGCLKLIKDKYNISVAAFVRNDVSVEQLYILSDINIIKGDITDNKILSDLNNFDCIIHSAGYGQPGKFLEDKIRTISINTTSTINLLNKLNHNGKFLYMSTSEIYNGLDCVEISEDQIGLTNTDHPRSSYIEAKRCGEAICYSYTKNEIDVKIARLSLAYGPGTKKDDHRVINSIIQKSIQNDKINLLDNGDAIRTYCYITDVVEMLWNILLFGKEKLYNVGGDSKITILDLAKTIGVMMNKEVTTPESSNELIGNPKVVNISTKRYKDEFGENKLVNINDGLTKTINWQKKIYTDE